MYNTNLAYILIIIFIFMWWPKTDNKYLYTTPLSIPLCFLSALICPIIIKVKMPKINIKKNNPGHCCGCEFTVCVCVCVCLLYSLLCVCALGWVSRAEHKFCIKCRAQILSMGHHTWPYLGLLFLLSLFYSKDSMIFGPSTTRWKAIRNFALKCKESKMKDGDTLIVKVLTFTMTSIWLKKRVK